MSASPAIVELNRATLVGPHGAILGDVDFRVKSGECVQISGLNGQGKSVLLEVLMGQHRLSAGTRRYPAFEDEHPDAKLGIAPRFCVRLVSSESQRRLSVSQASFYQARWHSLWTEPQTVDAYLSERQVLGLRPYEILEALPLRRDFAAKRARLLRELELTGLVGRLVAQLSNGELRKLMLTAAYLANPRLLLLDDPFGGLAEAARRQLTTLLGEFVSEGNCIVYTSAHELDLHELGPRRLRLHAGRLTELGAAGAARALSRLEEAVPTEPLWHLGQPGQARQSRATPSPAAASPNATSDSSRECILRFVDVSVCMSGVTLLENVSWQVRAGEHWVISGPNGSGKSTVLALLTGDHPQSYANDIEVLGSRLGVGQSLWQRRQSIGYVAPELVWHYPRGVTLRDLVLSGFDASIGIYRVANAMEIAKTDGLLGQFGLTSQADEPLGSLSEGTVRLGLLMRSMVHEPRLLLLDEPTQELGRLEVERFLAALDRVVARGRSTIVLVTHHLEERPSGMTHHLRLDCGRVIEMGPLASLPAASQASHG